MASGPRPASWRSAKRRSSPEALAGFASSPFKEARRNDARFDQLSPRALAMSDLYRLIVAALCVWRLTHLLQAEDGPWDISLRIRLAAGEGFFGGALGLFLLPQPVDRAAGRPGDRSGYQACRAPLAGNLRRRDSAGARDGGRRPPDAACRNQAR